ncbi:hypothetical protein KEM54_000061 [Ascosphaera aggregata]|nr:hypothetical protein KEM54_000061 [Ascosphaera aggregata]
MPPPLPRLWTQSRATPAVASQTVQTRQASILSCLSDAPGAKHRKIRRGRGPASGKGKTSGRGHKGQKQHGKVPAGFQGGQTPVEVVEGQHGFENIFAPDLATVNLDRLQQWIDLRRINPQKPITVRELFHSRCIHSAKSGVKLLANGGKDVLKQPLQIVVSRASQQAIEAVEAAGGTIVTRYYTQTAIRRIKQFKTPPYASIAWDNEQYHIGMGQDKPLVKGEGFQYRLPDPTKRSDIEYYRDSAHRGYLSHLVGEGETPSLFFLAPDAGKKQRTTTKSEKKLGENRGGNDTFSVFPTHLRSLISRRLPHVRVITKVYPQYDTKGELSELQDLVIDLEVQNESQSPTINPSVHVILIGHSMGGIVAAETILAIAADQPVRPPPANGHKATSPDDPKTPTFMFPHIQGLLAFDTPFLGICPGVISHTAEHHYKNVSAAAGTLSEIANVFGWKAATNRDSKSERDRSTRKEITPVTQGYAAEVPIWQKYGKYAVFAGAAGAIAAGGAAALYANKDKVMEGWNWTTEHLNFVNCLAKPELLRERCLALAKVQRERKIGATNFYTALGNGAAAPPDHQVSGIGPSMASAGQYMKKPKKRTFCNLPSDAKETHTLSAMQWIKAQNEKAIDEIEAHTTMFSPKANPDFYDLAANAAYHIIQWVDVDWYKSAKKITSTVRTARANDAVLI